MDYSDALQAMKSGNRVTRTSWIEPGKYVYWMPPSEVRTPTGAVMDLVGYPVFVRPDKGERGVAEPCLPTFDGLAGNDWVIVDDDGE
jgi:hypothetical protein